MIGWPDNQLLAQSTCKVRCSGRVPGRGIRVQDTTGASQPLDIHYAINVILDNAEVQQLNAVSNSLDCVQFQMQSDQYNYAWCFISYYMYTI